VDFVMNGGFSLRSKKLLQAPTALRLPFVLPAVSGLNGPPHEMYWTSNSHLEDVQLCIDMRSTLEQAGVKFAPLEMAKNFADGPTAVRPEPATLRCRALRPLLTR
jgi:hypothetical protein